MIVLGKQKNCGASSVFSEFIQKIRILIVPRKTHQWILMIKTMTKVQELFILLESINEKHIT